MSCYYQQQLESFESKLDQLIFLSQTFGIHLSFSLYRQLVNNTWHGNDEWTGRKLNRIRFGIVGVAGRCKWVSRFSPWVPSGSFFRYRQEHHVTCIIIVVVKWRSFTTWKRWRMVQRRGRDAWNLFLQDWSVKDVVTLEDQSFELVKVTERKYQRNASGKYKDTRQTEEEKL